MRVLVAYDGSPGADAALGDLARAGLPDSCEAEVLSVADGFLPPKPSPTDVLSQNDYESLHRRVLADVERCQTQAESAADRLRRVFPRWKILAVATADSPGWGVIRRAEGWERRRPMDLVVVGAASRAQIPRMLLGSVSHKVVTYVRCSVRISRFAASSSNRPPLLILGVDGSPDALNAAKTVCARNWPAGTSVRVVCAMDPRMIASQSRDVPSAQEAANGIADAAANDLRNAGLAASKHVTSGEPRQELLKQAEETDADCIFVGARGLSRVERILLGSVSTAVAMHAPCSVEVVRPGAG